MTLESVYPCSMELISGGSVMEASSRPYSQILEISGLEAGFYTVRIAPLEGTAASDYTLRIFRQTEKGKIPDFEKDDGTYARSSWEKINGLWYYFKDDTFAASGWLDRGDTWYYLSQDTVTYGRMETGWLYDSSYHKWFYLEEGGVMVTGWKLINGKWYYFHPVSDGEKGRMYADERTPDGYMTASDGEWAQ